jgi:hypothetical protein
MSKEAIHVRIHEALFPTGSLDKEVAEACVGPQGLFNDFVETLNGITRNEFRVPITLIPPVARAMQNGLAQGLNQLLCVDPMNEVILGALAIAKRTLNRIPEPPGDSETIGRWYGSALVEALTNVDIAQFLRILRAELSPKDTLA